MDGTGRFSPTITNTEANPSLAEALNSSEEATSGKLIGTCRELIFRQVTDGYEFDLIIFTVDVAKTLSLVKAMSMIKIDEENAKYTLAWARAYNVPVYPDEPELAQELQRLYAAFYEEGFMAPAERGGDEKIKLQWVGDKGLDYDAETARLIVNPTEFTTPGDALLAAAKASADQQRVADALRLVGSLRAAIDELAGLLGSRDRNENALQRCLTSYPILFGLNYQRVIPKFKLGSSYEMDYALEDISGLVDLVEIESSNLRLYIKSGNPTAHLVHAEQQVLDWLEWVEANARLVRDDLPTMMRPMGQVVIGRRAALTIDDQRRLQRRNASWQGVMRILTYDDVLDRGHNMLSVLMKPYK